MDRERLQQVQQSDLSESRVNEDFINWIKTSGPWYLLAILIGIAVYMYLVNIQRAEIRAREQAWFDLNEAVMPASLEDVAQRHAEIDSVGTLARLRAANSYLQSLQTNLAIGSTIDEGTPLSDEDRTLGLERADRLYTQIVSEDQGQFGDTITTVSALNGLAAVSESQGNIEAAQDYYEQAAKRAEPWYPILAEQARQRATTANLYASEILLPDPPAAITPTTTFPATQLDPLDIDNMLNLPSVPVDPPLPATEEAQDSEEPTAPGTP